MTPKQRHDICELLCKHTARPYFYYAGLSEEELETKVEDFGKRMVNNNAGELTLYD